MKNPKVRAYFDREAKDYAQKTGSGLLGRVLLREREIVLDILGAKSGESVLDAGCGVGTYAIPLFQKGCDVVALDISPAMVAQVKRNGVDARLADIQDFDLERNFDKVLCSGAVEFCLQPAKAIESISRHLNPGGKFVIVFPLDTWIGRLYWLYHRTHGLDVHLFSTEGIRKLLASHKFSVESFRKTSPFAVALSCVKLAV